MKTVNRAAIVITPKEPYLAWARLLDDDSPIDDMSRDELTSAYLVDADEDHFDVDDILRRHWQGIFDEQLHSWYVDRRTWPKGRSLPTFLEWFNVRVVEMVFDLGKRALEHDT